MKRFSNSYAVIGLGFGDEGKGLTVNSLCQQLPHNLVIRYSGGQQAGHTVTLPDGRKHTFSNFGSGTFQGSPTYWSKHCTFDPEGIVREWAILKEKGTTPRLYIDSKSPVTTPYDKRHNQISVAMKHGTCGVGVGATFQREEKFYSLLAEDLFHPSILRIKLELIRAYYGMEELDCEHFLKCCEVVGENFAILDRLPEAENYIFEGSQGLLLDQNIGFFPHVTRSNTGSKNILQIISENPDIQTPELFLITRAFQTRHGNGPMTNSHIPHNITENPNENNTFNRFQGEFKKSLLDLDLIRYVIEKDQYLREYAFPNLVITCLDLIKNEYRYTSDGKIVSHLNEDEFVNAIGNYLGVKPHRVSSPSGSVSLTTQTNMLF